MPMRKGSVSREVLGRTCTAAFGFVAPITLITIGHPTRLGESSTLGYQVADIARSARVALRVTR